MTVAADLLRLDTLDAERERRERDLQAIRRRIQRNPELDAARTRSEALQREHATAAAEGRALESDLAEVEGKIARDRKRMYSGAIVDARELGSLERELAHYAERRETVEDRLLALMERLETLAAHIAQVTQQTESLQKEWEQNGPLLTREAETIVDTLKGLSEDRDELAARLDPMALKTYTRIRAAGGHAVVKLRNGVCGHCRVTLPPKDIQHVRAGALTLCPNCGYILATDG